MNATQRKYAITKIKQIVVGKAKALANQDSDEYQVFLDNSALTLEHALQLIQEKKVPLREGVSLKSTYKNNTLYNMFDFNEVLKQLKVAATPGEAHLNNREKVYLPDPVNSRNTWERPAVMLSKKSNIQRVHNLVAKMDSAVEDLILGDNEDAINAIRSMEAVQI